MKTRYFIVSILKNGEQDQDTVCIDINDAIKPSNDLFTEYYKNYPFEDVIEVLSFTEITKKRYLDLI